ncbi:hypothetical protein AABB24_018361 [Solanum stoloniferum]
MKFREMLLSDSATNMSKPGTSIGKGQEKKGDIELKFFELHDLKAVTDNFSPDNKFGEGGFGPAFKGQLPDGQQSCEKAINSIKFEMRSLFFSAGEDIHPTSVEQSMDLPSNFDARKSPIHGDTELDFQASSLMQHGINAWQELYQCSISPW